MSREHARFLRMAQPGRRGRRRPNRVHRALWAVAIAGRRVTGWADQVTAAAWARELGGVVIEHKEADPPPAH